MIVYGGEPLVLGAAAAAQALMARAKEAPHDVRSLLALCGQLEQGVHDEGSPGLDAAREATREAARAFVAASRGSAVSLGAMTAALARVGREAGSTPLRLRAPEGFVRDALFPEAYLVSADRFRQAHPGECGPILVVGIRTIGTTLAAVVGAALEAAGCRVRTLTVRPEGPSFERRLRLSPEQVRGAAHVLVVDEGPGLSGSSMAGTAEALVAAGVAREAIVFLPSHGRGPGVRATAATRAWWEAIPCLAGTEDELWFGGDRKRSLEATLEDAAASWLGEIASILPLTGGAWRRLLFAREADWPAVFPAFERPKYLVRARDGRAALFSFAGFAAARAPVEAGAGLGTTAEAELKRLRALAESGFTPAPYGLAIGFVAQPWLDLPPLQATAGSPDVEQGIARYLASTAGPALPPSAAEAAVARLAEMTLWNASAALGEPSAHDVRDATARMNGALREPSPTYTDGRMSPHAWRFLDGRLLKLDAGGHVDDHTVVGSQPLAWDLAGVAVEWDLTVEASSLLARQVAAHGGPAYPAQVQAWYRMAYAAFRTALCTMSAEAVGPEDWERGRLFRAHGRYRDRLSFEIASLREQAGALEATRT